MTSQDTGGVRLPDGRAAASACRSGLTRSLWWLPSSSGCTARGVGANGRGWGALRVGGAFVQYAQPSASGSRPSWSRLTRRWGRSRTLTTGPQRRWRAGVGGGGPETEAPGTAASPTDLLLRSPVSTALTLAGPASARPAEIVGTLRFLTGVQRQCVCDVSTMDTHTSSGRPPGPPRDR